MARGNRLVFELLAGPFAAADFIVTRIAGEEALSELFEFQVEFFLTSLEVLDPRELFGAQATLSLRSPEGAERFVNGYVDEVVDLGRRHGRAEYRIRLVPWLRQLRHLRRSRIFQELSVPDIVAKVLKAGKVEHRLALSGSYPKREYCVQYRESDLDFVRRLLESEGICFFFEHGPDSHVMVLADAASSHEPLAGEATLPFRPETGQEADSEHITRVEHTHRLLPDAVALRDFDFERPAMDLSTKANERQEIQGLEIYDYPGEYVQPGEGKRLSKTRLEELRFGVRTLACQGTCHRLVPGATFSLAEHPDAGLNGELLLVRVRHQGQRQEAVGDIEALADDYQNEFLTLPAGVPYRPRRATPRPHISGIQTATVVGPSGEETQPDLHGRIKVQFHWDREGQRNDQSSCWMRAGQAWAGAGWGASFVPRVGQEVVVRFLEGNPDRPLVVGAVYNGSNPPPVALPGEKTKSTQRTDSSPGGGGFNEVRIEDAAGQEEVYLHAQKDENVRVLNDKSQHVRGHERLHVEKNRSREVHGHQKLAVTLNDDSTVEGNQTLTVLGNRDTRTQESHEEAVDGNQTITVGATHSLSVGEVATVMVGAAAALTIGGVYSVDVALASNEAVGGAKAETVAGIRSEHVLGTRTETVEGDRAARLGGDFQSEIIEAASLSVGADNTDEVGANTRFDMTDVTAWMAKTFKLNADTFTLIVGGKQILHIEKSGNVKWTGKNITIDGSDIKSKGKKIAKVDSASASSKSLPKLKLESLKDPKATEVSFSQVSVTDAEGKPLAGVRFQIEIEGKGVVEGVLDAQGGVSIPSGPKDTLHLTFPDLDGAAWKLR